MNPPRPRPPPATQTNGKRALIPYRHKSASSSLTLWWSTNSVWWRWGLMLALSVVAATVTVIIRSRRRPMYAKPAKFDSVVVPWQHANLKTGDLLLFAVRKGDMFTSIVKAVGKEPVNHMGVVLRDPDTQACYCWDIVRYGAGRLVDLHDLQHHYPTADIAVRRFPYPLDYTQGVRVCRAQSHHIAFDPEFLTRLIARITVEHSDATTAITSSPTHIMIPPKAAPYRACTDITLEWYQLMGTFRRPLTYPVKTFWPADFAIPNPDIPWNETAGLSWPPEPLIL